MQKPFSCNCSTISDAVKGFLKKFTIIYLIQIYWLLNFKEFFLRSQKPKIVYSPQYTHEETTYTLLKKKLI